MLAEILEHYGAQLFRDYGRFTINCPFHPDRHKSGSVDLDRGLFHCFVCGWGGDAITIVMHEEGLGFKDAVSFAETTTGGSHGAIRVVADAAGYGGARRPGNQPGRRSKVPPWKRG